MRQGVVRYLRDLEELVFVYRTGAILVQLHEPLLQANQLGRGDYGYSEMEKASGSGFTSVRQTG